jgi:hypothetical protein
MVGAPPRNHGGGKCDIRIEGSVFEIIIVSLSGLDLFLHPCLASIPIRLHQFRELFWRGAFGNVDVVLIEPLLQLLLIP